MFDCVYVHLSFCFVHLNHTGIPPSKVFWKFCKDWTWFSWDIVDFKNSFLCLFVCFCFLFESSRDTPGNIVWMFCKDWKWFSQDIVNLKNCLIVCLFISLFIFFVFSYDSYQDTPRKIFWEFCKDWACFSWDIVNLKNCFSVCFFVCLLYLSHLRISPGKFSECFINIGHYLAEILSI